MTSTEHMAPFTNITYTIFLRDHTRSTLQNFVDARFTACFIFIELGRSSKNSAIAPQLHKHCLSPRTVGSRAGNKKKIDQRASNQVARFRREINTRFKSVEKRVFKLKSM